MSATHPSEALHDPAIPKASRAGARFELLDGFRGLLALAVVLGHFSATSGHREIFASSSLAVDFFFCLSGFVIAHAYESRLRHGMGVGEFMGRRLIRLYPLYLAGLVLGVIAVWPQHSALDGVAGVGAVGAVLLNALYLPFPNAAAVNVHGAAIVGAIFPYNNPSWSLFFEWLANLAYACIVRISTAGLAAVVALSALGVLAGWGEWGESPGWGTANVAGGICRTAYAFFFGVLLWRLHPRWARLGARSALFLAIVVVSMVAVPRSASHGAYWLAAALVGVPLVVAFAARCDLSGMAAATRACDYSGRMSYPVYCLHYPLMLAFWPVASSTSSRYALSFACYLAVVLLVSHFALTRIDEPLRAHLSNRRRAMPWAH